MSHSARPNPPSPSRPSSDFPSLISKHRPNNDRQNSISQAPRPHAGRSSSPSGFSSNSMASKRSLGPDADDENINDTSKRPATKKAKKRTYIKGTAKYSKSKSATTGTKAKWTAEASYATLPQYSKILKQDAADRLDGHGSDDDHRKQVKKFLGDAPRQPDEIHGVVSWTASEKDLFFEYLARKGRDDVAGIAAGIGTKGVLEVTDLLRRLKEAYVDRHLHAERLPLVKYEDLSAAVEIGRDLEDLLDTVADAAVRADEDEKVQAEEEERGAEYATLNADNAGVFYEEVQEDGDEDINSEPGSGKADNEERTAARHSNDDGDEQLGSESPTDSEYARLMEVTLTAATTILDLPRLLELSEYVFMNSGEAASNWRTLHLQGHSKPSSSSSPSIPSILQSALLDLYANLLNHTYRLISSTVFIAASRIRSTDTKVERSIRREVHKGDVLAAIDVMGLKRNAREFWVGCPRKCGVRVFRGRRDRAAVELNYEQVEQVLREEGRWPRVRDQSGSARLDEESSRENTEHEEDDDGEDEDHDVADDVSIGSISTHNSAHSPRIRSTDQDDNLDSNSDSVLLDSDTDSQPPDPTDPTDAAEAFDQRASALAEIHLRAALQGKKPPQTDPPDVDQPKRKIKYVERKTTADLRDWRDWVGYKAEWERYPRPVEAGREMQSIEEVERDGDVDVRMFDGAGDLLMSSPSPSVSLGSSISGRGRRREVDDE